MNNLTPTQNLETTIASDPNRNNSKSLKRFKQHFDFPLTKQQNTALGRLDNFLYSQETLFVLAGYAGTGKSSIIFAIVKKLIKDLKRVALTAPTNKAVAILRQMAVNNGLRDLPCLTIHQLLGLGMVNRGQEKVLAQTNSTSVHLYDVVFLDECSMVGAELWQWLERSFETSLITRRKLILMGDPAQLNPVGEKRSPTFEVTNRAILTEVVRQALDNPLSELVAASRQAVKSQTDCFVPFSCYNPGDKSLGAFKVKEKTLLKYAIKKIKREFAKNPDGFRLLCYRNERVKYYNQIIRWAIYGQDAPQFFPGERLITKKPVVAPDGQTVILPTSCEITVQKVTETKHFGYRVWQLLVYTDENLVRQIFVLHSDEQSRYESELEYLYQKAQQNSFFWHKYYRFRDDLFAKITNCYALTVHQSQGSTFEEGAIDGDDLVKRLFVGQESEPQKRKEYNRLWYVAISRFQQRLFLVTAKKDRNFKISVELR